MPPQATRGYQRLPLGYPSCYLTLGYPPACPLNPRLPPGYLPGYPLDYQPGYPPGYPRGYALDYPRATPQATPRAIRPLATRMHLKLL